MPSRIKRPKERKPPLLLTRLLHHYRVFPQIFLSLSPFRSFFLLPHLISHALVWPRARTYAQTPVDLEGEGRPYGRRIAKDQESTDLSHAEYSPAGAAAAASSLSRARSPARKARIHAHLPTHVALMRTHREKNRNFQNKENSETPVICCIEPTK